MTDMNGFNKTIIEEFRANDGKVGGQFENATLLLLHTKGAKSGKERVNPLVYFMDDKRLVIVASKGGAPSSPDWYYNLIANPEVRVEVGAQKLQARAVVAREPERTVLFEKIAAKNPGFADYQRNTDRIIPIVLLTTL